MPDTPAYLTTEGDPVQPGCRPKREANHRGWLRMIALAGLLLLLAGCGLASVTKTTGPARRMGWIEQDSGTGNNLFGVCFTNVNNGWAVGEAGLLLATSDGGAHWRSISSGTWQTLWAVTFTDRLHGWVLADHAVIRTSDEGRSWSLVQLDSDLTLHALAFTDRLHGIAVGLIGRGDRQVGIILRTSDGGQRWGTAWEQSSAFPGVGTVNPSAIGVVDRQHIVVASTRGVVLSSGDGGESWSLAAHSASAAGIQSLAFPAGSRGWAVGDGGRILQTPDGGRTWRLRETIGQSYLSAVAFPSKLEGWIVGGEGTLLRTSDGGAHWSAVAGLPRSKGVVAESWVSPGRGWAVGDGGCIYAYR